MPDTGADIAEGGAGDDLFELGTAVRDERDTVNGGLGRDSSSYNSSPGRLTEMRIIEANLETLGGEKDTDEQDVLRSVERYVGGLDEDIMTGVLSSNDSTFDGGPDDDTVFGGSGPNTIVGGAGADQLDGNGGDDVIDGKSRRGQDRRGGLPHRLRRRARTTSRSSTCRTTRPPPAARTSTARPPPRDRTCASRCRAAWTPAIGAHRCA